MTHTAAPVKTIDASRSIWGEPPSVDSTVLIAPTLSIGQTKPPACEFPEARPTIPPSTPTQTLTPTPNATATPDLGTINGVIQDLAAYGITAYLNGVGTDPNNCGGSCANNWTLTEILEVRAGVRNTAYAFNLLKGNGLLYDPAKFKQVMGPFSILKVKNGYQIAAGDPCNGTTNQACTTNFNNTVIFFGAVNITQYTTVHEFGHRFNGRTLSSGNSLYNRMEMGSVNDIQGQFLFGTRLEVLTPGVTPAAGVPIVNGNQVNDWVRGRRGWGSGLESLFNACGTPVGRGIVVSNFQQNSFILEDYCASPGTVTRITEIDEATADMFLNWIYAIVTNRTQGFQDISWIPDGTSTPPCDTTNSGCADQTRQPGQSRYNWMNTQMPSIFATQSW